MTIPPPAPPPPFPLHPATANLMISVMSKTSAVVQLALHSATTEPNSFMKTYEELCKSNNLPPLNLGSLKLFADGVTTADDLDVTSFLSANGDSSVTATERDTQVPINNASSPISMPVNNENFMLNTSPASPIEKTGSHMSMQDINIPQHPLPSDGNDGTAKMMPLALDSSPSGRSPLNSMQTCHPRLALSPMPTAQNNVPSSRPMNDSGLNATISPFSPPNPHTHTPPLVLNDACTTQRHISPNTSLTAQAPSPHQVPDTTPTQVTSPLPTKDSPTPTMPNTLLTLNSKTEPDNAHLAEKDDEFELFTTKRTRIADRSQLKQWHNEGRLAIKRNGKIVINMNEFDLILKNKFEALTESRVVIDDTELNQIVENRS